MSYLQPFVRQVRPRNESHIPPVDKIQNFLSEAKNTLVSDINELLVGYYINKKRWYDKGAKTKYQQRVSQVDPADLIRATEHAKVMASAFILYAKNNGYSGKVKVYWTARAGSMTKLTGVEVDQTKNPTDTLIQFSTGDSDGWLGISAKSTKGKGEIGFKNPGVGTIDRILGLKIAEDYKKEVDKVIANLKLPITAKERKIYIRANSNIKAKTQKRGSELLSDMRDTLFDKLDSMKNEELLDHFMEDWLNANVMFPPYIKITGKGNKPPYTATIVEPTQNDKNEALATLDYELEKVGNESIGVKAGNPKKKIFKMRFKFESEKLASSVKMSGESW